ncbi:tRNA-dihydrouridine synthase [Acrasis kona]|uniref:tRNA-dihydrouridine(47) synthase [NAD(P)(+)] n=1 Tax=Acrasis kona TaxID=1008807 RepID=A0AAW2ZR85_9EUKA
MEEHKQDNNGGVTPIAKGVAYIKPEYLVSSKSKTEELDNVDDAKEEKGANKRVAEGNSEEPPKKKARGQNKDRYQKNKTSNLKNTDGEKIDLGHQKDEKNKISHDVLKQLRGKKYDFKKAEEVLKHVAQHIEKTSGDAKSKQNEANQLEKLKQRLAQASKQSSGEQQVEQPSEVVQKIENSYVETKYKPKEVKRIDFSGKLYMAPLTTVGNLPFRRLCKGLGVDVTCGEMAVASNLIKGQVGELSLLRRHASEDLFGVQIAGAHQDIMIKLAQLIDEQFPDIDFVDINCGCPVDLICSKGMGSGLMERRNKMQSIVRGMKEILRIPLTLKMRTGIKQDNLFAHKLFPEIQSWGINALTLHGRTKQQRYTKEADWEYIEKCSKLVRQSTADQDGYKKIYTLGNGDIYNYTDYQKNIPGVDAIMIGRGALIKPWIFTEIKQERHWDISASERMDLLKDFCKFGMDHYGSDEYGIQTTRRYLLEWISFTHRYVPVGLLERVPMAINERPQRFMGRNDLETLMASGDVRDWITLSEMAGLGPVVSDFQFVPKHKSNSYEAEG